MSDPSLYQQCYLDSLGSSSVLECISNRLEEQQASDQSNLAHWILVITGSLVFFMQTGFAMLCAGCVRKKNVQNTMLKNLLDACGAAIAFYCIGFAFAFGGQNEVVGNTFIGYQNFFLMGDVNPSFFFFEYAFSATSTTIVAGTLAERCQMAAYLCYSVFLSGFVYPVAAHSLWSNNGFLSAFSAAPVLGNGCIDFAGSGVVHLTGGTTSLIATYILGPRRGRFYDSKGRPLKKPRPIPGHSMALQLLGTMVLWFGWYGFNPGSAMLLTTPNTGSVAALAASNTSLAAASGAISGLLVHLFLHERRTGEYTFDLVCSMNGALSGLIAITAGCATVEYYASVLIGLVAGAIYVGSSKLLIYLRLDDAVDAIPVHMASGAWGLIATGLFTSPTRLQAAFGFDQHAGLFYEFKSGSFDAILLLNQVLALLFIFLWCVATMGPFFVFLNYMGWFRTDSLEEIVGLDMSYHGGTNLSEFEDVTPEHMKAFKAKRSSDLRRRRFATEEEPSENGAEEDEDDADASWTEMTVNSTPDSSQKPESAPRRQTKKRQSDVESIDQSNYGSTYSLGDESEYTGRS